MAFGVETVSDSVFYLWHGLGSSRILVYAEAEPVDGISSDLGEGNGCGAGDLRHEANGWCYNSDCRPGRQTPVRLPLHRTNGHTNAQ